MIIEGSQQWQNVIFGVAGLFMLYNVWRGWRVGVVRGVLRLAALFCAWIGGSGAAGVTGTLITFFTKEPPLLAPALAGLGVGLAIYIVISLELLKNPKISAILQDPALERASQNHNVLPLLRNKNVQAAATDPQVLELLRSFDLTAALNFALEPPVPKRQNGKLVPASSRNSPPVPVRQ